MCMFFSTRALMAHSSSRSPHDLQFVNIGQLDRIESEFQILPPNLKETMHHDHHHLRVILDMFPLNMFLKVLVIDSYIIWARNWYYYTTCMSIVYVWCQYFIVSVGCYLGYSQKEKHRVWIDNFSQQHLEEAEKSATDYISLGKVLLQIVSPKNWNRQEGGAAPRVKGGKSWTKTSSME